MWVVRVMCLAGSAPAFATKVRHCCAKLQLPGPTYPGAGQFVRRAFPVRHGDSEEPITKPRGAGSYFHTGYA